MTKNLTSWQLRHESECKMHLCVLEVANKMKHPHTCKHSCNGEKRRQKHRKEDFIHVIETIQVKYWQRVLKRILKGSIKTLPKKIKRAKVVLTAILGQQGQLGHNRRIIPRKTWQRNAQTLYVTTTTVMTQSVKPEASDAFQMVLNDVTVQLATWIRSMGARNWRPRYRHAPPSHVEIMAAQTIVLPAAMGA